MDVILPGGLLKIHIVGLRPQCLEFSMSGGTQICTSNKFSGDTAAAAQGISH